MLVVCILFSSSVLLQLDQSWVWCHRKAQSLLVDLFYVGLCTVLVILSSVLVFWTAFALPLTHFEALLAGIEQVLVLVAVHETWPGSVDMLHVYTTLVTIQIRLFMKCYSFIRENAYKVLYPWNKDDETGPAVWYAGQMEPQVGSFSAYVYFLFCPTLLYRDRYPR